MNTKFGVLIRSPINRKLSALNFFVSAQQLRDYLEPEVVFKVRSLKQKDLRFRIISYYGSFLAREFRFRNLGEHELQGNNYDYHLINSCPSVS